jgi:hypothetical protein
MAISNVSKWQLAIGNGFAQKLWLYPDFLCKPHFCTKTPGRKYILRIAKIGRGV